MRVKDYKEAVEAIDDLVFRAKIPMLTMVAVLEVTKHRLMMEHTLHGMEKETVRFFAKLQKEAEKQNAGRGVS